MFLALTDEQAFLREAAGGALSRVATLESARAVLDGEPAADLWPLAIDAGWPGLLSGEDADGAELGAFEAVLVLEACGRRLGDAGLIGHLPAVAVLEAAGADLELRRALASGEQRAALVCATHGVIDAAAADVLVVPGVGVVDAAHATVTPAPSYDGARAIATVELGAAEAVPLDLPEGFDPVALQRLLLAAEAVGAAEAAMELACEYAKDRMAFGRAIGSYQAIKHKLVEMLRRVELARSLVVHAGRVGLDSPEFALAANAARVSAAEALDYAGAETIFIHGGIGATWEHDAMLFYRRAELSRRLCGGVEAAAEAVAAQLLLGV